MSSLTEKTMPKTIKKTVKAAKATKKPNKKPVTNKATKTAPAVQQQAPAAPPTYVSPPVAMPAMAESARIWEEIRYRPIEMFALPNQIVEQHCTPFPVDPNRLYLTVRSTATLPSLEASCGKEFVVELADRFIIITRAVAPLVPPKK